METIYGPVVPLVAGSILYHITLVSGMIITSPSAFGKPGYPLIIPPVVASEDGQILSVPRQRRVMAPPPFNNA